MVDSDRAEECSYLLDRYKQDVYLYQLQQTASGTAPPAPSPAQAQADKTAQHRQTLRSVPTPDPQGGGVGVPGVTTAPQTSEELWVEEVERRLRAQRNHCVLKEISGNRKE